MTREYFNTRYAQHCDKLKEYANAGKLVDAQRVYGRICELCAIAHELGTLNRQEYSAHIKQAEDCFYDSL